MRWIDTSSFGFRCQGEVDFGARKGSGRLTAQQSCPADTRYQSLTWATRGFLPSGTRQIGRRSKKACRCRIGGCRSPSGIAKPARWRRPSLAKDGAARAGIPIALGDRDPPQRHTGSQAVIPFIFYHEWTRMNTIRRGRRTGFSYSR